jgi:hypothetical protein
MTYDYDQYKRTRTQMIVLCGDRIRDLCEADEYTTHYAKSVVLYAIKCHYAISNGS